MLSELVRECLVISRTGSGELDAYGDELTEFTSIAATGYYERRSASETNDVTVADYLVVLYPPVGLNAGDAVSFDEATLEIQGDPWQVSNPRTGAISHVEADARKTEGVE